METNHAGTGFLRTQDQVRLLATNKTIQKLRERTIEFSMFLCALSSIAITLGIVGVLLLNPGIFSNMSPLSIFSPTPNGRCYSRIPGTASCHWSQERL